MEENFQRAAPKVNNVLTVFYANFTCIVLGLQQAPYNPVVRLQGPGKGASTGTGPLSGSDTVMDPENPEPWKWKLVKKVASARPDFLLRKSQVMPTNNICRLSLSL